MHANRETNLRFRATGSGEQRERNIAITIPIRLIKGKENDYETRQERDVLLIKEMDRVSAGDPAIIKIEVWWIDADAALGVWELTPQGKWEQTSTSADSTNRNE